jgi:hypothetical protein
MTRALIPLGLALFTWLGTATDARACKMTGSIFEHADAATTVAVTRVDAVKPPARGKPGHVRLSVTDPIEGAAAGDVITIEVRMSSCDPRPRKTRSPVLVLTQADGRLAGKYRGYVTAPSSALIDALKKWSSATASAERVTVLLEAMASGDVVLGWEAVHAADAQSLQATLDEDQRARLASAVESFRSAHAP